MLIKIVGYSEQCDAGNTWYQNGNYGQCCPASAPSCYAATACVSGSLIFPYPDLSTTATIACTEAFSHSAYSICNTAFIFENMQDSSPLTDIICGDSSVNWSFYRKMPNTASDVVSRARTCLTAEFHLQATLILHSFINATTSIFSYCNSQCSRCHQQQEQRRIQSMDSWCRSRTRHRPCPDLRRCLVLPPPQES